MRRNQNRRHIWIYTKGFLGRRIGLALAMIWIFGGAVMVLMPSSWMAYQTPVYLVMWVLLKLAGCCALYMGIGTAIDLWNTRDDRVT